MCCIGGEKAQCFIERVKEEESSGMRVLCIEFVE